MSFRIPLYKSKMTQISCNNLVNILNVDTERQIVQVEPGVTMKQINDTLLPLNWTLAITPELDDLTIGGLVMGTGIESSSHKFGLFQNICESFELLLSDGSLVTCAKDNDPDLFYAIPWSYGTLGFLTSVELKIIPCTKYIRLTYKPLLGIDVVVSNLEKESMNGDNDFIDAIMFSANDGVLMTGEMVKDSDVEQEKINEIGKWYKPWFFMHVKDILNQNQSVYEYIPLKDYYHRHSRSIFWEIQDIIPFGNHILFRYLFGWLLPIKVSLLKLTQSETIKRLYENNHIIQDLLVPISKFKMCINKINELVKVYPIWLCPFKLPSQPGLVHSPSGKTEMYIDIGIYGPPQVDDFYPVKTTRALEELTVESNGFQMLYADTYMNRAEFRKMFDHTCYDQMRKKLMCETAFPEIFDKVNRHVRY